MNIVHVTESLMERGGSEKYLRGLGRVQTDHGDKVSFICSKTAFQDIPKTIGDSHHIDFSHAPERLADEVLNVCRETQADCIHLHHSMQMLPFFMLIPWLAKSLPVFFTAHCHDFYCPSGTQFGSRTGWTCDVSFGVRCLPHMLIDRCQSLKPWVISRAYPLPYHARQNHRFLKKLLVASNYQKKRLVQNGFDADLIFVLPFFIDQPPMADQNTENQIKPIILFSGRVVKYKGLEHLIRALQLIQTDCEVVVNGVGEDLDRIKRMVSRWGLETRVSFQGWVEGQDLSRSFHQATLVVMPALWPEPQGVVGLEALLHGKPVVAYNVGGIAEWLKDGEVGYLVEPQNVRQLAEKIELLLKDKTLTQRLGAQGQRWAKDKFGRNEHYRTLNKVYQDHLG